MSMLIKEIGFENRKHIVAIIKDAAFRMRLAIAKCFVQKIAKCSINSLNKEDLIVTSKRMSVFNPRSLANQAMLPVILVRSIEQLAQPMGVGMLLRLAIDHATRLQLLNVVIEIVPGHE